MESVILTHKKLQRNIFLAFASGLSAGQPIPKGYFISFEMEGKEFTLELWKSATVPENGDAKMLHRHNINKGEYQMNDVRTGVMIAYLRDQTYEFMKAVNEVLSDQKKPDEVTAIEMYSRNDLVSFGRYLLSDDRTIRIADPSIDNITDQPASDRLKEVYHADVENWKH